MKKVIAVLLSAAMLVSVAACGNKKTEETKGSEGGTTAAETQSGTEEETDGTEATEEAAVPAEYVSVYDLGDISEYVELGTYKGIEVTAHDLEVTDEEVEAELQGMLESAAPVYEEVKEGDVKEGDVVNIDFEGKIDGVAFEGGAGEDFNLTIGSGQFIEGFEAGLIGVGVGETVDLDLSFPDPYQPNPDYSGKAVVFTVTVNYIQGEEIPQELNDAFVENMTDGTYKTLDEYRVFLKEDMKTQKAADEETAQYNESWTKLIGNSKFHKEAEELIQYFYEDQIYRLRSTLSMYGMDLESYLTTMGVTQEQMEAEFTTYAKEMAQVQLVVRAIAEKEGLEPDEGAYEEEYQKLAERSGMDVETMKSSFEERMLKDVVIQTIVQDFVKENTVEVEAPSTEAQETTAAAE